MTGDEDKDKAEEYKAWTIEGIENIRKLFKQGLKDWDKLRDEQKADARQEEQKSDCACGGKSRGCGWR